MRAGITPLGLPRFASVGLADRGRLEAVVNDRNAAQKHVWRAKIVLLTADGPGTKC